MSKTFAELEADLHTHLCRDPNIRLYKGVNERLDELPDPSNEWAESQVGAARALLADFEALDASALSFDQRLDVDLAVLMLKAQIHDLSYTFNGRTMRQQTPKAGDEVGDGLFLLFINDPRPDEERLADIGGRMEAIPGYLEAMLARLDTPLERWVTMDIEKVEGLGQLFGTIEDWAKGLGYAGLGRLQAARKAAEEAVAAYVEGLKALPTTTRLHVGPEVAARIVEYGGIDKSFDELHGMARDFLADTRETIEALRQRLVAKYGLPADTSSADLHRFLAEKYRVELSNGKVEDILAIYENEREAILSFIEERDLFPILDDQDMKIIRTPSFMVPSIPAGAMLPPPAFREGTRTSMVYLTLSEELMDEHTELSIPSMMVHEGIPGHHLQLATASAHPSVIRRHVDANDHAEGWTTMLEDYMLDAGYKSDLADEVRFCGKRDLSRIGARVAIDLFFMTGDKGYLDVGVECDTSSEDPFVAAGNLLQEVTGFVPERVQAELNWYSQERGYPLSYLTGNSIVWDLKKRVEAAQAGKLEGLALDRRFHELYLHSGAMPLSFFERVLEHEGLL